MQQYNAYDRIQLPEQVLYKTNGSKFLTRKKTRNAKISNSCQHSTVRFAEYERLQANDETALMPIYYSNCCEVRNS